STDNGRTFTKYSKNPVLTPFDGLENFRDPKVFWYAPEKKWVMIVNINPGFVYGGSGTMYFVGDFDGHRFVCDTEPSEVKWL
ncbi:hypothetical protein ACLI2Q_18395, partial [Enterococcus faecalis]